MNFFKPVFIFAFLLSATSCWGPSQKSESLVNGLAGQQYSRSTFRVAEVNNTSAVPILKKGNWKVPHSLRYKFKVKITSKKDARLVIGHAFFIKTGSGKLIKEITKSSGWLEWHEDIAFNFFSNNPSYLVLKREIIGTGLHQGSYIVEMAINPWAIFRSQYPSFVHLDKKDRLPANLLSIGNEQIIQSKLGFTKTIEPHYPLDIANAKVFISQLTEYNDHVNLEVKLEMNLLAKMKDSYGENILYKLKSGRVQAFVSLMATNIGKESKEHAILFHSSRPLFVEFTAQDRALISYKGKLYNEFNRGNLAIAIRLVPEGVSLAPFEALYSLGSYRKILGKHAFVLDKNSAEKLSASKQFFSYAKFLEKASNIKKLKKQRYIRGITPFKIVEAIPKQQAILPGETALIRTANFRTKFCFQHTLTGAPVVDEHFFVTYESKLKSEGSFYTNDEGCLPLAAVISHKIYKPQKYFLKKFHFYHDPDHELTIKNFETLKKNYKRFNKEIVLSINPWDEKFGNFGFDNRYGGKEIPKEKRLKTQFFLENFSYNTLGFKYRVNDYLNLEIRKRLLLVLRPYALRYNSLSYARDESHRPLRDGVYLMKIAFQKTYLKPSAEGVTVFKVVNKEEKLQSIISSIPFEKQKFFQSQILDLKSKDKAFYAINIQGLHDEDLLVFNLEKQLLGIEKNQSTGEKKQIARAKEYVTAYQKLVKVQNGLIIEDVALNIHNPILMKIRGNLLIQLEAVDEKLLQIARLYDARVSEEAKNFLKIVEPDKTLSELAIQRILISDKTKRRELEQFLNKKQEELKKLIRLVKHRSIALAQSKNTNLASTQLPEELKQILQKFSFSGKDIIEIEENNFMKLKGKSLTDPNLFLAKDSGLEKRTFVGPVTLVAYDNNSYMRPTDSLELSTCGRQDCLIEGDGKYEASLSIGDLISKVNGITKLGYSSKLTHEYFEHEQRLAGVSVDDLIKRQKFLNKKVRKKILEGSSFDLYTKIYGLDYISDYSMLEKTDTCFKDKNFSKSCNKPLINSKDSVKKLNLEKFKTLLNKPVSGVKKFRYAITHFFETLNLVKSENIKSILETGKIKEDYVRSRICRYMVSRLTRKQLVEFNLNRYANIDDEVYKNKKEELKTFSLSRLIGSYFICDSAEFVNRDLKISSFYKIYKVNADSSSYKKGQSFNVNVATNFSLRQSVATRFDINPISDPAKILGIPGLGGLPYRFSFSKSSDNAFTLSSQVMLSAQQSSIAVNLLAYKKCIAIYLSGVARGVVLCGKLKTEKKQLIENYYYISQHFTPGDQLDMGALYNHPWLIRMRGHRDMLVFLNALRKDTGSDWRSVISGLSNLGTSKGSIANPFTHVVDNPLNILDSIKDSYKSFLPSYPSHYQILE